MTDIKQQAIATVRGITKEQAGTLAMHNIDPNRFQQVAVEALLSNPAIKSCNANSLRVALRRACQDGLVPNGKEACLIPKGSGDVDYMPMVGGICKMAHRYLKATITSGHVRAGEEDNIKITQTTQGDDVVEIRSSFRKQGDPNRIVGAWALIKVPGQDAFCHIFWEEDIKRARARSSVKSPSGPWGTWTGRMAEKAVVKSAVRKALNMFPSILTEGERDTMERSLDADIEEQAVEDVIEPEAEIIEEAEFTEEPVEAEPEPEPKPKPKAKPKPKKEEPPVADVPWDYEDIADEFESENPAPPEPAKKPTLRKPKASVQKPFDLE